MMVHSIPSVYSKKPKSCACRCYGARKQDAPGFARKIHEISRSFTQNQARNEARVVDDQHDEALDAPNIFEKSGSNSNNFYSKHSNTKKYNENDHTYTGQRLGHLHTKRKLPVG